MMITSRAIIGAAITTINTDVIVYTGGVSTGVTDKIGDENEESETNNSVERESDDKGRVVDGKRSAN